ncbi:hypothetical protein BR93DRAFT_428434 [Coniochaeta sp. PMI_546]|nr:hypothetical protein BR93DRAFT_428434 [Coniochaeta sp. PMI_546]
MPAAWPTSSQRPEYRPIAVLAKIRQGTIVNDRCWSYSELDDVFDRVLFALDPRI